VSTRPEYSEYDAAPTIFSLEDQSPGLPARRHDASRCLSAAAQIKRLTPRGGLWLETPADLTNLFDSASLRRQVKGPAQAVGSSPGLLGSWSDFQPAAALGTGGSFAGPSIRSFCPARRRCWLPERSKAQEGILVTMPWRALARRAGGLCPLDPGISLPLGIAMGSKPGGLPDCWSPCWV